MRFIRRVMLIGWIAVHGVFAQLAVESDAHAEASDRVFVVYVEAGSDVDAAEVRGAVAAELGARVPEPGDPMPPGSGLLHVRSQGGLVRVTFRDARGRTVQREMIAADDAHARARMIALLAGNLARNEADELLGGSTASGIEQRAPSPQLSAPIVEPTVAQAAAPVIEGSSWQRTVGWLGVGGGVVSAGIGAALSLSAAHDLHDRPNMCDSSCIHELDAGRRKAVIGNLLIGSGVLLGVVGTVMVLTAPSGSRKVEPRANGAAQGSGAWVAVAPQGVLVGGTW